MISRLIAFIERKKDIIESFYKYSNYLIDGEYIFDNDLTFLYLKDNKYNKVKYKNLFDKKTYKSKLYKIIIFLLRYTVFNNTHIIKNKTDFEGTLFLPANTNDTDKDIKIFDYNSNKVLTIHANMEKFNKKIETYNQFKYFYPIPPILRTLENKKIIVEQLIDYKPKHQWSLNETNSVISKMMELNLKYFKHIKNTSWITPLEIVNDLKKEDYLKKFIERNKSLLVALEGCKFPVLQLHGDLWFYNILLDLKGNIYFIDWEHSQKYILFYDFFWFMQYEANYNSDYTYINKYFLGKFDIYLQEIFNIFDIKYNKDLKLNYFYLFILEICRTRLIKFTEKEKVKWLGSFESLFHKIKELYY